MSHLKVIEILIYKFIILLHYVLKFLLKVESKVSGIVVVWTPTVVDRKK